MFRIKQLDRLSLCYLKLGDSIRAKSYLKKAIMFDHNEVSQVALPGVLLRLSRIMINEFQLDSARILAERAFIIHNEIQDRNRISSLRVLYDIYKMQHDSLALDKIKDVYMQELASENKRVLQADLMVEQYNKQRERINSNSLNIIQSSISIYQKLALFILVILVLVQIIWWKRKTLFCYWHQLYPINGQSETSVTFKSKNTSQQPQTFSRDTLEHQVGFTINATDWKVIELLMAQPLLTVEELAAAVFLSKDGMKTSLRRLYKTFNIKEGGSKKGKINTMLEAFKGTNRGEVNPFNVFCLKFYKCKTLLFFILGLLTDHVVCSKNLEQTFSNASWSDRIDETLKNNYDSALNLLLLAQKEAAEKGDKTWQSYIEKAIS